MQTLNLEQLKAATLAGGVLGITLRAEGASFVVDVQTQRGQATMVTSRQQTRRFVDPRKALQVLRGIGWNACQIDVGQWRPGERAAQTVARPDRSAALKAAHQAAQADAGDADQVAVEVKLDGGAQGAHGVSSAHRVGRAAEAADLADAVGERAEQQRAMRDRLVAGDTDVAAQGGDGGDEGHRASSTGKTRQI